MSRLRRRQMWLWLGLIGWCGLLTMLTYSAVLRLPLVTDDWTQLPYAASRTLGEIWQGAKGPAYYRPLAFTVWKSLYVIFGHQDEVALHALNVALHFLNSLLVGWLSGRLWSSSAAGNQVNWRRRYLAAGLFLLFPFSYDAISWIAAMMHPLVILLMLASLISYVKGRDTSSSRWYVLSLVLALLSPFAHETGVLVGPLIVIVELTWPLPAESGWRRLSRAGLWLAPMLIWWLIWRSVPVSRGAGWLTFNSGKTLWRNSVYFLQGAAYPVTWLGGWLSENLAIDNMGVAAGLAVVAFAGAVLIQWRSRANRRAGLPWLWLALTSAPAVLFLDYKYVSGSPRMLMLMSVGAAWLWTDVIVRLTTWSWTTPALRRLGLALTTACVFVIMAQNVTFVRDRIRPFELGGSVIRQIADRAAASTGTQPVVFINLPAWISPAQVVFGVGQEGVMFLPSYFSLEMITRAYIGQASRTASIKNEAIRSAVPYYVGLRDSTTDWSSLAASGGQVFVTNYTFDRVTIQPAGALKVEPVPDRTIARFDQLVTLKDASVNVTAEGLQVALDWQVTERLTDDVTVFVHVLDASGQLVAQGDGDPVAGSYPFNQWPKGLVVRDFRLIDVEGEDLAVRVGLYRRSTGERLTALTNDGTTIADNAVPLMVQP
jgi:hypothetical protein